MVINRKTKNELSSFYLFWSSQLVSQIGSSMSSFALTLYILEQTGSAFLSALLSISFYIPYSLASMISGVFADRFSKKALIQICDTLAAGGSLLVLILLMTSKLDSWHLVWWILAMNGINGICNAFQNPAAEAATNRLIPEQFIQKTSGLRSLAWSLNVFLHPLLASALYPIFGLFGILIIDLLTFLVAFSVLQFRIQIPERKQPKGSNLSYSFGKELAEGLAWLNTHRLVLGLIVFMASVNFNASAFDNALPVYLIALSKKTTLVGIVSSAAGAAMIIASFIVTILPAPKNRIRLIVVSMMFSLTADNFLMPFVQTAPLLILAQFLGYLPVPFMNASLTAIFQSEVPDAIQGRVYACRNALQFLTIPLGSVFSGFLIDQIIPGFFARVPLAWHFGPGQRGFSAFVIFLLGISGFIFCAVAAFWFSHQLKSNHQGQ
ncbi:MFS transporter [Erysipelotrichaceae bacterium RD49]|nr:MFS transporter [Erysipelotrichaceae bacterium RD49]